MELNIRNHDSGPRYAIRRPVNGIYRFFDKEDDKTKTLGTKCKQEAQELVTAMNDKYKGVRHIQKMIAIYQELLGDLLSKETWQDVMNLYAVRTDVSKNTVENRVRGFKSKEFDSIRDLRVADTLIAHLNPILDCPKVSIRKFLRDLHNYAIIRRVLPSPIIPPRAYKLKRQKELRPISEFEHFKLISTEKHQDFRLYLELMWETGASNSDLANLCAENFDHQTGVLMFARQKNDQISRLGINPKMEAILEQLPKSGLLFPRLHKMGQKQRTSYFYRRCRTQQVGIFNLCLHGYRHSFAKRAFENKVPIEEVMAALGHKCSAVTLYYGRTAEIVYRPRKREAETEQRGACA